MFIYFFIWDVKSPRCVGRFCTLSSTRPNFITLIQNFGALPKQILGARNMQNLALFRTTLKFGGKYLRNEWKYSKSDKYFIYRDLSRVRRNKSSKVWSSNLGDLDVKSYSPKVLFFRKTIFYPPMGCCAPIFLHALEHDSLSSALPTVDGGPLTIFFQKRGGKKLA